MTYSIKNLKTCRGMEDDAFSCTLLRDGKPVAEVNYGGTGGCYLFHWLDRAAPAVTFQRRDYKDEVIEVTGTPEEALFAAHVFAQPKDAQYDIYANDDIVVGELVSQFEAAKRAKRLLKTHLLFKRTPTGDLYTIALKGRNAEAGFTQLKAKYPEAVWINTEAAATAALMGG